MTDLTNGGSHGAQPNASAQNALPQMSILGQYIKDFSFENPNAPRSLQPSEQPAINIEINVEAQPFTANEFEVAIRIEGKAEAPGMTIFSFDLLYAGVFRIQNVPQESMQPMLMVECPRLIFPFAREIIASAVTHGGFPPLLIDPIDFLQLYRQKMEQGQQQMPAMSS